jgi:hypothetical protein
MIRTLVLSIAVMSSFSLGSIKSAWSQSHTGKMDTDGILSPGEIPNPRFNYNNRYPNRYPDRYPDRYPNNYPNSPYDSDGCNPRRGLPRPRVEIYDVRRTGNVFADKVKVRGAVEGVCITEAGLFEEGRLVRSIPTAIGPRFQRFEFEVTTHLGYSPEVRAYNTAGDRDIAGVR